jgi:predicted esterase
MKKFLLAFALLFLSLQIFAQGVFEKKSFVNEAGQSLFYQILFPVNYDPSIKYPVVLVLHGAGERGDDNVAQMKYGTQVFLNPENQQKFPAIVIFPQCPKESYWSSVKIDRTQKPTLFIFDYSQNINWPLQSAIDLVKSLVKSKVADKKRLYIMGLSMGGMGTMEAVSRNPKMFAAASPLPPALLIPRCRHSSHWTPTRKAISRRSTSKISCPGATAASNSRHLHSRLGCSHGEKFSQEELEEMLAAAVDVETGRIYYEDFAELLADS